MNFLRRHITWIFTIWLFSVVSLDVVIPLHFFVKQHAIDTCHADDNSCCSTGKSVSCEICAFDLFIGYLPIFNFEITRTDILLYVSNIIASEKIIFKTALYAQLRAPPVV